MRSMPVAMHAVGTQMPPGSFSGRTDPHLLALQTMADIGGFLT